jgi:hypothetical protein
MAAGFVVIPWYATGFRDHSLGDALDEVAPIALRYGATSCSVYRARDDLYKFQQFISFEDKLDWERFWEGEEMTYFRARYSGWYQVPLLYGWWDRTAHVAVELEPVTPDGAGNGVATGESA